MKKISVVGHTAENLEHDMWHRVALALNREAKLIEETGAGETYGDPGDKVYALGPDMQADVVAAYSADSCEGWVALWPLTLNNVKRQAKLLTRAAPTIAHGRWLERLAKWYGFASYNELRSTVMSSRNGDWSTL